MEKDECRGWVCHEHDSGIAENAIVEHAMEELIVKAGRVGLHPEAPCVPACPAMPGHGEWNAPSHRAQHHVRLETARMRDHASWSRIWTAASEPGHLMTFISG